MKKLTYTEFEKRITEVAKARRIFIPHLTKSITDAFAMYQEVLANEKMAVFLSTENGNRPATPLDDFVRPKCPECSREMRLHVKVVDINGKAWESAWRCESCILDIYSDKTIYEWMNELEVIKSAKD
jgi:hypothetical protein